MGNNLTVDNQLRETNVVTITLAGSKDILAKETFSQQRKKDYNFPHLFFQPKTFIVSVNDKISRAIGNHKSIRITESEDGQLRIIVLPKQFHLELSIEQIIENEESNLNWNIIADQSVKNEYVKATNDRIKLMNQFVEFLGTGVGTAVRMIPTNATVAQFGSKFASDMITNFMKTSLVKTQSEGDAHSMERFQNIHHQLIAVSRAIDIDYAYLTEERKIDNEKAFEFLHNQMMKITNTDMLPFLEVCNEEEAIVIYIFAIGIVMEICEKMNRINVDGHVNKFEQRYMSIFAKNLHEIWQNILDKVAKDVKVKTIGCLVKTAQLKFRDNHVYKVQSFLKSRANDRMRDIKEAFIMNMRYQLDFLNGHPETVIRKCEEFSGNAETTFS